MHSDTRSHTDSMGTRYESTYEYYTRFPNMWARIRYDSIIL